MSGPEYVGLELSQECGIRIRRGYVPDLYSGGREHGYLHEMEIQLVRQMSIR